MLTRKNALYALYFALIAAFFVSWRYSVTVQTMWIDHLETRRAEQRAASDLPTYPYTTHTFWWLFAGTSAGKLDDAIHESVMTLERCGLTPSDHLKAKLQVEHGAYPWPVTVLSAPAHVDEACVADILSTASLLSQVKRGHRMYLIVDLRLQDLRQTSLPSAPQTHDLCEITWSSGAMWNFKKNIGVHGSRKEALLPALRCASDTELLRVNFTFEDSALSGAEMSPADGCGEAPDLAAAGAALARWLEETEGEPGKTFAGTCQIDIPAIPNG